MANAIHSSNWWAARLATETAYGSGSGAVANTPVKLSALVGMAYPRTRGSDMYPIQKVMKEELDSQDDGQMGGEIVTSGWESKEGTRDEYVQDKFYWTKLLALYAAGQGKVPPSYAIHWQDHIRAGSADDNLRYESFGCYIKELSFVIPQNSGDKSGFPYWSITDACYETWQEVSDAEVVDSIIKVPWLTTTAAAMVTQASFSIGGNIVNNIEAEMKFTTAFDETKEAGDDGLKFPYYTNMDVEFTCKFRSYAEYKTLVQNILKDTGSDAYYTVKINTGLTTTFIQVTNMMPTEGDFARIPEKGMVSYEMTFKQTSTSVISEESS